MANKKHKDLFNRLKTGVVTKVSSMSKPAFEPTGAMEPVIVEVGTSKAVTTIINVQCNNKSGKSAVGAEICANIMWENDPTYFNYPLYQEWPFSVDGRIIKNIRIVGTSKNVSDTGPIREEILKWWPRGRYKEYKDSQRYYSKYVSDTGWIVDVMTFDQHPKDFEGRIISFHWIDEPAKPDLMGAFLSRHSHGGIVLLTQTPIGAAPMLDVLSDLKDQGFPVIKISSNIYENSITSGRLNSTGTKRGLMSDAQIESFVKSIPPDQQDARVWGRGSEKEGKIYKKFNEVHVRDFDIFDPRFLKANCYCSLDIHETYYPFLSWWAIFPPNDLGKSFHVCYNEWPTKETFNGKYYDEVRKTNEFNMTKKELSDIIKLQDRSQYGYHIIKRGMDPRAAKKSDIQMQFLQYKLKFEFPRIERIAIQRDKILTLMDYDDSLGAVNIYTEPSWFITPNCKNMIRAFSRHFWENKDGHNRSHNRNKDGVEAERYKDPVDTARIFESLIGLKEYIDLIPKELKKEQRFNSKPNNFISNIPDVCLFKR